MQFFENGMRGHKAVDSISYKGDNVYIINRTDNRPSLTILVADIYIAGEADILELITTNPNIDCIVLIGFYNRYSGFAKSLATERNIGLYENREFFGAVNCTGKAFLRYERKKKDE